MDLALQISVPPDGEIYPRPRDLRRRCRASGLAVRREGCQFRPGGRRKPGVETRSRAEEDIAGSVARELSPRPQPCCPPEHPGIDPLDRFHGAWLAPGSAAAKGGAVAGQGDGIRQAHDQWRTALGSLDL